MTWIGYCLLKVNQVGASSWSHQGLSWESCFQTIIPLLFKSTLSYYPSILHHHSRKSTGDGCVGDEVAIRELLDRDLGNGVERLNEKKD